MSAQKRSENPVHSKKNAKTSGNDDCDNDESSTPYTKNEKV